MNNNNNNNLIYCFYIKTIWDESIKIDKIIKKNFFFKNECN